MKRPHGSRPLVRVALAVLLALAALDLVASGGSGTAGSSAPSGAPSVAPAASPSAAAHELRGMLPYVWTESLIEKHPCRGMKRVGEVVHMRHAVWSYRRAGFDSRLSGRDEVAGPALCPASAFLSLASNFSAASDATKATRPGPRVGSVSMVFLGFATRGLRPSRRPDGLSAQAPVLQPVCKPSACAARLCAARPWQGRRATAEARTRQRDYSVADRVPEIETRLLRRAALHTGCRDPPGAPDDHLQPAGSHW